MIRLILTDVDGVLTDGKLTVGKDANISKQLCFKDLDAITSMRRSGYKIGILTGENDFFTDYLCRKIEPDYFETGCKDKKKSMLKIAEQEDCPVSEICYVGDGKYDLEAIKTAGLGVCPRDAIDEVKMISDIVLERNGGEGCLAEVFSHLLTESGKRTEKEYPNVDIVGVLEQHRNLAASLVQDKNIQSAIEKAVWMIVEALKQDGQVLFCGNGGSAADAQHLSTELVSRFYMERRALNSEALTVNTSALTAIGNDYHFDKVFARQVEAKGHAGDVLVGITTSGTSKNVLEALQVAKQKKMRTIMLTGQRADTANEAADVVISVPSAETPRIQEMHILIGHIICEYIEKIIFDQ